MDRFAKGPDYFIERVWGLTVQAICPEYKSEVARLIETEWDDWETAKLEFRPEMFMPFEKGKNITWQQWLVVLSVKKALASKGARHISIASGHGTGKSSIASMLILWFLFCYPDAQIPCTAPTSDQMYDVLWKELSLWITKMPKEIKPLYQWESSHIRMKDSPETWFARAKTASKENPEALAGVHGDNVLMLVDEASGVPEQIFNTAEGALTNANIIVLLFSNPTRAIGYFFDTHHKMRSEWQNLRFDSRQSPIVDSDFEDRMAKRHGLNSTEYNIRVAGIFPQDDTMDDSGYVPLLSENDIRVSHETIKDDGSFTGTRLMGIDAAGEGEDTTEWAVRDNIKVGIVASEKISNPKSIAEKTMTLQDLFKVRPIDSCIENFGSGADVMGEVAISTEGKRRISSYQTGDVPEDADDAEMYINLRAAGYFKLRAWLRSGGEIVDPDGSIKRELITIRFKRNLKGKLQIMPKLEMRKKYGFHSPNKADAIMLTFLRQIFRQQTQDEIEEVQLQAQLDRMTNSFTDYTGL